MRVAITSCGPSMDSSLDERFGRARYVLIVDTNEGLIESIDNNENMNAAQGAGINATQMIADKKVDWLVTGHVGPKAFGALQHAGISVYVGASGTCSEALEKCLAGSYQKASGADVNSHW